MGGLRSQGVRVVLLDIEGTVCPISFVKDVLFPYALSVLPSVLQKEWDSPTFAPYKNAFPPTHRETPEAFTSHVRDLISRDVKIAYLKSLQGYLWLSGYESGALKCPLFPDVFPALLQWVKRDGLPVMIYSSGSVAAQELLFQYTDVQDEEWLEEKGNLRPLIDAYFDTTTAGMKTEKSSYERIMGEVGGRLRAEEFLFLSDNVREVNAAREAGMKAVIVVREGNAALSEEEKQAYSVITSFAELEVPGI